MENAMTQLHWSAAARLLDREMPEGYVEERTDIVSTEKRTVEAGTKSIVIFRIGLEWMGLSTKTFQEVTEPGGVHKLPHHVNGVLKGLVNVRGELLLCAALDVLLGLPAESGTNDHTTSGRLLVCNREGNRLAFIVSEVHGVHHFHPRDLKDVPATLAKAAATYTVGVLHWEDKTVGCLDDELLFYALDRGLV
jgi:chemotaxis-related protein WspD